MNASKIAYVNNTNQDVSAPMFHKAILSAIAAGGVFGPDLADIFSLRSVEVDGATGATTGTITGLGTDFFTATADKIVFKGTFATGLPVGRPLILVLAGSSTASTSGFSGSGAGGGNAGDAFDGVALRGGGNAGGGAADWAAGMTSPHFGHLTARPAYSSFTDSVAEHDGHTKRIGIEKLLMERAGRAARGLGRVECIHAY